MKQCPICKQEFSYASAVVKHILREHARMIPRGVPFFDFLESLNPNKKRPTDNEETKAPIEEEAKVVKVRKKRGRKKKVSTENQLEEGNG
jgi:hypothetical protein